MVLFYSSNKGKIAEVTAILKESNIDCISAQEAQITTGCPETGATFVENAILKARDGARQSGSACLADDSGLIVDALPGHLGVNSARYAGETASDPDNINHLLSNLNDLSDIDHTARFVCCMVYMRYAEDPFPLVTYGILEGKIVATPSGEYGFGYDPIFYVPDFKNTLASLTPVDKNRISHRALACQRLCQLLTSEGDTV